MTQDNGQQQVLQHELYGRDLWLQLIKTKVSERMRLAMMEVYEA